nr:MAG TPA: hypothetical protein [Caudoviricetes sp.]
MKYFNDLALTYIVGAYFLCFFKKNHLILYILECIIINVKKK